MVYCQSNAGIFGWREQSDDLISALQCPISSLGAGEWPSCIVYLFAVDKAKITDLAGISGSQDRLNRVENPPFICTQLLARQLKDLISLHILKYSKPLIKM